MSDASPIPPPPAPAGLDPQTASAREAWVRFGHDPAAFDAAMSGQRSPDPAAPPANTGLVVGPDPSRVADMAQALLKFGVPAEDVAKAVAVDGFTLNVPPPDARTPEEQDYDRFFGAPASPDAYRIDWFRLNTAGLDTEPYALDGGVRDVLHAASLPASIGAAVAEHGFEDAANWQRLDEGSRQLWDLQQSSELARLVPNTGEAVKNAAAVIAIMRDAKPELVNKLIDHGVFRSARVISQLHLHAERMMARGAMAARRAAPR